MLVLQRKSGEALMIGESIYIKFVQVDRDRVKIAIDAPKQVDVFRTELITASNVNEESTKIKPSTLEAFQQFIKNEKKHFR